MQSDRYLIIIIFFLKKRNSFLFKFILRFANYQIIFLTEMSTSNKKTNRRRKWQKIVSRLRFAAKIDEDHIQCQV